MPTYDESTLSWVHQQCVTAIVFIVLACLFPTLLIITRKLNNPNVPKWGWDEILVIPGMLVVVALCSLLIVDAESYTKILNPTQSYTTITSAWTLKQKAAYIFSILYPLGTALPKLSLCTLYHRIFSAQATCSRRSTHLRTCARVTILFLIANAAAFVVPSAAVCSPPSLIWRVPPAPEEILARKCLDRRVLGTWINLPHIVSDIAILAMPLPMVWGLKAQAGKRVELTLVFLTGGIGILGATTRFALYIHESYSPASTSTNLTPDKLHILQNLTSILEPLVYLIAACLPALLGFITRQDYARLFCALGSLWSGLRTTGSSSGGNSSGSVSKSGSSGSSTAGSGKGMECGSSLGGSSVSSVGPGVVGGMFGGTRGGKDTCICEVYFGRG